MAEDQVSLVRLDLVPNDGTARMQQNQARAQALIVRVQVEVGTEKAVIPPLCFLQPGEKPHPNLLWLNPALAKKPCKIWGFSSPPKNRPKIKHL